MSVDRPLWGILLLLACLLQVRRDPKFGRWCTSVAEKRRVWTVPLSDALRWVGRPVDLIKIDAQGARPTATPSNHPRTADHAVAPT